MDRGSTFSDDRIIARLQTQFVPVAGNTHELQNQKSKSSEWFMSLARAAKPDVSRGITAQGFYVAGADGKSYGFNNNRDPERVLQFMLRGQEAFRKDPPANVAVSSEDLGERWSKGPSAPAQTLRMYSRIRPLPPGCDKLNHGVGRDTVWLYESDVAAMLAGEGRFPMPPAMKHRLVRYHLVDNVRGEPDFWRPGEIRRADFTMWRKDAKTFAFEGAFSMATANGARGLRGTMEGEVRVEGRRASRFLAYGQAVAWGAGTYTPRPPEGEFPIVFALKDVDDAAARVTPPQAAAYGDYDYKNPAPR